MEKTPYFIINEKNCKYLVNNLKSFGYYIAYDLASAYDKAYFKNYPVLVLNYNKNFGTVCNIKNDVRSLKNRYLVTNEEEFLEIAASLKNKVYKRRDIVTKDDLIKELKNVPIEIAQHMVDEQIKQGNKPDVQKFQYYITSNKIEGGFDWNKTEEGEEFWSKILFEQQYDIYFIKYKKNNFYNINDLKSGMVIEYKNGDLRMVTSVNNKLYFITNDRYACGQNFCYDLSHISDKSLDICKVYKHKENTNMAFESFFNKEYLELIWERKLPKVDITKEEIAKKFGCKVEQINII